MKKASNTQKGAVHKTEISISRKTIFVFLGIFVGIWALMELQNVISYLLFSLLFATALHPLVAKMQSRGLKRGAALAVVLMFAVGGFFGLLAIAFYSISNTIVDFSAEAPTYLERYSGTGLIGNTVESIQNALVMLDLQNVVTNAFRGGGSLLSGLSSAGEAIIFTFFFTVYMLLEKDYLLRIIKSLIPEQHQDEFQDVSREAARVVSGYIRGQVITSFGVGLATYIVLILFDVPNAFALAIIAAFSDVVPIVGFLIGIVPIVLVALTINPVVAIAAAVVLQAYSIVNSNVISPRIYGHSIDLSPFIITLSSIIGLALFGVTGILLALPVTAILAYVLTKYKGVPLMNLEQPSAANGKGSR